MPNNSSYGGNLNFPSGLIHMQEETKPSHHHLGFSVDGLGNRSYGSVQENNDHGGGRILLPFGGVKQIPGGGDHEVVEQNNKEQGNSSGFWTGMIGEGSW